MVIAMEQYTVSTEHEQEIRDSTAKTNIYSFKFSSFHIHARNIILHYKMAKREYSFPFDIAMQNWRDWLLRLFIFLFYA